MTTKSRHEGAGWKTFTLDLPSDDTVLPTIKHVTGVRHKRGGGGVHVSSNLRPIVFVGKVGPCISRQADVTL